MDKKFIMVGNSKNGMSYCGLHMAEQIYQQLEKEKNTFSFYTKVKQQHGKPHIFICRKELTHLIGKEVLLKIEVV